MTVSIGSTAPDFELKDQHGASVRLSDFRGRAVLVTFIPFAFTGICTGEICEMRDAADDFINDTVATLAITCDSMFSLKEWATREGIDYPLLSDFWPHGATARAYGVFNEERGCALRGTFLVDADGVVRWSVVNQLGDARSLDDYRAALAAL